MTDRIATDIPIQQIACQQVLLNDSSVFSIQWTDLPAAIGSGITVEQVYQRYLSALHRQTLGLIVPVEDNGVVSFMLAGRYPLLSFLVPLPVRQHDSSSLCLHINGGLLVQPDACKQGELEFRTELLPDGGTRVLLRLSDYCPVLLGNRQPSLFRRWLYRMTQAAIHRLVTIRFLVGLYRELAGSVACVRLVRVQVRDGQPT